MTAEFQECESCAAKPGTPTLWRGCLANRAMIERLTAERDKALARVEDLEAFIIDTRGDLKNAEAYKARAITWVTDLAPQVKEWAASVQRGTGTARNFENQYRHAEYRAKLTKETARHAHQIIRNMIITVGSVADRTANSVNPEDILWLRDELDRFAAYEGVMAAVAGDPFLDGVIPELDLSEGTGVAGKIGPIPPKGP